jgi:hypothetical protein
MRPNARSVRRIAQDGRLADTRSEGLNARARQVGLHLMELGRHALSLLAPRTRLVARMRLRREAWGVQRL